MLLTPASSTLASAKPSHFEIDLSNADLCDRLVAEAGSTCRARCISILTPAGSMAHGAALAARAADIMRSFCNTHPQVARALHASRGRGRQPPRSPRFWQS